MRVVVMEDYQRAVERLRLLRRWSPGTRSSCTPRGPRTVAERAAQIGDAEALVLIRERTPIDAPLLDLLPHLRLICQTGRGMPHIDVGGVHAARDRRLQRRRVAVRARRADSGTDPRLVPLPRRGRRRAARRVPGRRRSASSCTARRSGSSATERSARSSRGTAQALGMHVLAWGRAGSLARAGADGHEAGAGSRGALRALRRREPAAEADARDARDRDARGTSPR